MRIPIKLIQIARPARERRRLPLKLPEPASDSIVGVQRDNMRCNPRVGDCRRAERVERVDGFLGRAAADAVEEAGLVEVGSE